MLLKILLITLACLIVVFILVGLFLIAPKKPNKKNIFSINKIKFAHRGIYNNKKDNPENSINAFEKAIELGYGIELDVRLTKDKEVVVFHDHNLQRMCNDPRWVEKLTLQELKEIKLLDSNETIPTFKEVLELINGKVPLLIEYKAGLPGTKCEALCVNVNRVLEKYTGNYIVESSNQLVLKWYRKNRPNILRGQISIGIQCYEAALGKTISKLFPMKKRFMLTNLLYNYIGRPNFINYRWQDIKFAVKLNQFLGAKIICWTVNEKRVGEKLLEKYDSIIFENYLA